MKEPYTTKCNYMLCFVITKGNTPSHLLYSVALEGSHSGVCLPYPGIWK